jgi:PAS domain S-box-containing protein
VARKLAVRIGHGQEAVAVGGRSGVVEWTNSAWERITGWAVERTVSKPISRLLDEIGIERDVVDYISSSFLAGRRSSVELPVCAPDGRQLWIHLEVDPCRDAEGEITDFVAVATDITDRRLAEQALERHMLRQGFDPVAELRRDLDPAPVTDALRGVASEAIRAARALQSLAERLDRGRFSTDRAGAVADELRETIAPLLARFEGEPIAQRPVHVPELVAARCRRLVPQLSQQTTIDLAIASDTPKALGDKAVLADVIDDLMQASARALAGTWGTLSVTVGRTEPGQALVSEVYHASYFGTLTDEAPRVFIELHDTAPNVPPKDLVRIAAPLLPSPPEGRAFTLLRSRLRTEEMGGELHVSAAPGCGTRLLLLLPLAT